MKRRWKVIAILAAASVLCAFLLWFSQSSALKTLEETRRALRQQGFKIDLAEFNFSTSEELRARAAALTNLGYTVRQPRPLDSLNLLPIVGSNSAMVVWKHDEFQGNDLWPTLRETLNEHQMELDSACESALSGPIRFDLKASAGNGMLLPHLAALKRLAQTLATRVLLELHDGNKGAAWTNLLVVNRLVTAWDPEPVEISHLVRFGCATIAFQATWQALQGDGWRDDRLAELQREWESVEFFKGLPETAAFKRASMVASCQLERQQPFSGLGLTVNQLVRSPRSAWYAFADYWRRLNYRRHGSYEDEKDLLLHYREREQELRRAVNSLTWSGMSRLPGVTNLTPFQSKHFSSMQDLVNIRQIMLASHVNVQGQGQGWLGRAADAEARRRLMVTAVALKRYNLRHGSYPNSLRELVPELVKDLPADFMDGKPLRYRRTDDGHFVLYSVGLDCMDNHGEMQSRGRGASSGGERHEIGSSQGTDLVWPCPASEADVRAHRKEEDRGREDAMRAMLARAAEEETMAALRRERTLAKLEALYAKQQPRRTNEPTYRGRPLSKLLRNREATGTNQLTLDELLTLKAIPTGNEPDFATFEVPIRYDVMTNIGELHLLVDGDPEEEDADGEGGEFQTCERAANGSCLLVWKTTCDPPGKHFLQAHLRCTENEEDTVDVKGLIAPFFSSNVFQLHSSFGQFGSSAAYFSAKLAESNGLYTIELSSPAGEHIKTITGSTSNGVIDVQWDLIGDHGKRYTNDSFQCAFRVTLPDSGRSQTLKGP